MKSKGIRRPLQIFLLTAFFYGGDGNTTEYEGILLLTAALSKSHDEVERLIDQGVSVAVTDSVGWTPLHYALTSSSEGTPPNATRKTALTLIERGAPVNAETTVAGWRPLHLAVWQRDPALVGALIEHGADVNAQMRPWWGHATAPGVAPVGSYSRRSQATELVSGAPGGAAKRRRRGCDRPARRRGCRRNGRECVSTVYIRLWVAWYCTIVMYPDPRIGNMSVFTSGYVIEGSFTAKAADERLISEPIGYIDELHEFVSITGILGKDGHVRIQWVATNLPMNRNCVSIRHPGWII